MTTRCVNPRAATKPNTTKNPVRLRACAAHLKLAGLAMSVLLLSACTGMNADFHCNAKAGDSCMPISQVNQLANAGAYNQANQGQLNADAANDRDTASTNGDDASAKGYLTSNMHGGYTVPTPTAGMPVRLGDEIQRVWVAPFEDSAGTFHEASFVYMVLKPAKWIGHPVAAITADDGI